MQTPPCSASDQVSVMSTGPTADAAIYVGWLRKDNGAAIFRLIAIVTTNVSACHSDDFREEMVRGSLISNAIDDDKTATNEGKTPCKAPKSCDTKRHKRELKTAFHA